MANTTTLLTVKDYAELKKCTLENITKKIRNGNIKKDKSIVSVNKYGRVYLIEVNIN